MGINRGILPFGHNLLKQDFKTGETLDFCLTINEIGRHGSPVDECHAYGSTRGCDSECPVLRYGACDNYESVIEQTEEAGFMGDAQEIREIYTEAAQR